MAAIFIYIISQHSLLIWLSLVNCVECIKYTKEYEDGKRAAVVQHIGYCVSRYVITKLSTGGCCCCYVYLFYEKFVSGRAHLTFLHRFHRSRNLSERYTSTYKRSINSGLRCWTLFVSKNFRSVSYCCCCWRNKTNIADVYYCVHRRIL
jgi:hypothetical protein